MSAADGPIVVSTWKFGYPANQQAWKILAGGGYSLDAVEAGARHTEADPAVSSVGYGGTPDADGVVTVDACVMDEKGQCGSVAFVQRVLHPVTLARQVMEQTSHVMLVGSGAEQFAGSLGIQQHNLLTSAALQRWETWNANRVAPFVDHESHDTIGLLARDKQGRLCGACTTSGISFKMHGRVGDSPIIGSGLYVDGDVGAAVATGYGEAIMKICASFLIVEMMRNGASAQEACRHAMVRLATKYPSYRTMEIGFLALSKDEGYGAFGMKRGFFHAVTNDEVNGLLEAECLFGEEG